MGNYNYPVVGPVVKRITKPINKPPKNPGRGGGQGNNNSAFEAAIDALAPIAWYRFREPNFNNRIRDYSGNNRHLLKQIAAATRSSVPTRTTHPGGAYFPAVTETNWATTGTFYKRAAESLLSGSAAFTLLVSVRFINAPTQEPQKIFGVGTEATAITSGNQLAVFADYNPTNAKVGSTWQHASPGGVGTADTEVTGIAYDGVNRLFIMRWDGGTIARLTSSKPGHAGLTEESTATSGSALAALNQALILNARTSATTGSATTPGFVVDQAAIWGSDIGATAETNLHTLWTAELGGYYPSMMQFDGSTGYYSHLAHTTSGNKYTTIFGFNQSEFTGASVQLPMMAWDGSNLITIDVQYVSNDHADANYRNRVLVDARNSSNTVICRLFSPVGYLDGADHMLHFAFDGDNGTAIFRIDGADADDLTNAARTAPTTGTMASGANSDLGVGANGGGSLKVSGKIGPFLFDDSYITDYTDFMDGSAPLPIDEKNWTECGAQPLFWSHTGQMDNNKGSAGDMTANGTITMTTGGSPP